VQVIMLQYLKVSEIFYSIQGESTYAGLPCILLRLTGCNLRCLWCDTPYAQDAKKDGQELSIIEILENIQRFKCRLIEVTGGEPLVQHATPLLLDQLVKIGYDVLIETNGTQDLAGLNPKVRKILDVKCPSSGFANSFLMENLELITPTDEVKFVIADREDYDFSKAFLKKYLHDKDCSVLFSPVYQKVDVKRLPEWILEDNMRVKYQIALHKYIWGNKRGK
jgi:7-carboxy-7-deazaguanine synthase